MRIDPQISPMPQPVFRLVAEQCSDHTVRSSRAACEQRIVSPDRCDRYERTSPESLLYADYLEKQNQRKPDSAQVETQHSQPIGRPRKAPPAPIDTGLAPKLGDIPSDNPAKQGTHQRVVTAYQVQRYAPTGSLVDVTI